MTPLAEPFTEYLAYDIVRVLVAPAALVLAALVFRLAMHRWRRRWTDPERYAQQTHPAVMLSFALCLFFMAIRRVDSLGTPWSWYVVPSIVILVSGYIGVLRRVDMRWPWRRHR